MHLKTLCQLIQSVLMKKVAVPLTKNILVSLGITAAASAIDARIQNIYI